MGLFLRRREVQVCWKEPAGDKFHSAAVSHEVEAFPLGADGISMKQTTKGAACKLVLTSLLPGTNYQVTLIDHLHSSSALKAPYLEFLAY